MMLDNRQIVTSLNCGVYSNWGGGLLIKLTLISGLTRILVLQTEQVFMLHENLQRSIIDGQFSDPRQIDNHSSYLAIVEKKPTLTEHDFEKANDTAQVIGWSWDVFTNGIIIEFQLVTGISEIYSFNSEVTFLLLDQVSFITDHGYLVDLREFRQKSVHEMEVEIADSKGYMLIQAIENFDISRRLLDRNYEYLKKHIQTFEGSITNLDFVLWVRRHSVTIFMEETLRLLHNFVAACLSLVDHSRVFFKKMDEKSMPLSQYQEEVTRRFSKDPLTQFVVGLRQYIQHYRLPSISTVRHLLKSDADRVLLDKHDLLAFSKWNASAKEFIHTQPDKIYLLDVLEGYHNKIMEFHCWLREEWNRIYWRELREAELKRQTLLAKRGTELVSNLERAIQKVSKPTSEVKVLELFTELLSAEELFQFKDFDGSLSELLSQAIQFASKRYFLSNDLKDKLRALGKTKDNS